MQLSTSSLDFVVLGFSFEKGKESVMSDEPKIVDMGVYRSSTSRRGSGAAGEVEVTSTKLAQKGYREMNFFIPPSVVESLGWVEKTRLVLGRWNGKFTLSELNDPKIAPVLNLAGKRFHWKKSAPEGFLPELWGKRNFEKEKLKPKWEAKEIDGKMYLVLDFSE